MTRYAKPVIGKKQAEEASSWATLKQTVVGQNQDKPKKKKKKQKKMKENVENIVSSGTVVEKTVKESVNGISSEDTVVKKLKKKKRNKQKVVDDAIKLESTAKLDLNQAQHQGKQGKGKLKFSKLDPETKRAQRAEVHRNRRAAKDPCFVCRSRRHKASDCPKAEGKGIGMCFKCASTEHTSSKCPRRDIQGFPHAKCFICNETGHLSRACPDNPRGLYPNGGCCKECGSVEHFAKDCPTKAKQKQSFGVKLKTLKSAKSNVEEDDDLMDLDQFIKVKKERPPEPIKPKVVKF